MTDDTTATFPFPAVGRKKITAAFDGGRLSSDGGVAHGREVHGQPKKSGSPRLEARGDAWVGTIAPSVRDRQPSHDAPPPEEEV